MNSQWYWDEELENPPENVPNFDLTTLESDFTEVEVEKVMKSLKNGKSPGEDMITNEFLKQSLPFILPFYTNLFNTVLETGHIPESWTTGVIVPIYKKKGDPKDPANYRGITLVSALGKVFTRLLNDRLEKFANDNDILLKNQAGFRKNHATTDHVYVLQTIIELFLKKGKNYMLRG